MNEEGKEKIDGDSPARVRRTALVLTMALIVVVVLSFYIFNKKPVTNTLGVHTTDRPYSKSDQLVRKGWLTYREQGDTEAAQRMFMEAKRLAPYHQQAVDACGQMAMLRGQHERAFKNFHELHTLSSKSRRSYSNLALALMMMGRNNEAERMVEEAIKVHKLENDLQFLLIRACIRLELDDEKKANEYFSAAVANGGVNARRRILRVVSANEWAGDLKQLTTYESLKAGEERGP